MKQIKLTSNSYNDGYFELARSFSFIKIKTIILDTLCEKDYISNWVGKLQDYKPKLVIELEGSKTHRFEHSFLLDITGQHTMPIFNYDNWYLPYENLMNSTGKEFYNKMMIKLNAEYYSFRATIIYEDSPGVKCSNGPF